MWRNSGDVLIFGNLDNFCGRLPRQSRRQKTSPEKASLSSRQMTVQDFWATRIEGTLKKVHCEEC